MQDAHLHVVATDDDGHIVVLPANHICGYTCPCPANRKSVDAAVSRGIRERPTQTKRAA